MMLLLLLSACGRLAPDRDEGRKEIAAPESSARKVIVPAEALVGAGITVVVAAEGRLHRTLDVPATLALDPTAEGNVGAPAAGRITRILVRPGDAVAAETTLAWVRSTDVADARAAWASASARQTSATARRDRLKLLLADGISSRAQLLDAEAELADAVGAALAAAERLALYGVRPGESGPDAPIRSPVAGTVLEMTATIGAFVTPETPLFHVGDADQLWLLLAVPDAQLASVYEAQRLDFLVDGQGDDPFHAQVAGIGRWVDPTARTVNVRATVTDPTHRLRPNQFARATLVLDGDDEATGIVLPAEAVQSLDGGDVVFVEGEPGQFTVKAVHVAARAAGDVRLDAGVSAGDRVAITGAFAVKGQLVKGEFGGDDE